MDHRPFQSNTSLHSPFYPCHQSPKLKYVKNMIKPNISHLLISMSSIIKLISINSKDINILKIELFRVIFSLYIKKTVLKTNFRTVLIRGQGHFCHCFTIFINIFLHPLAIPLSISLLEIHLQLASQMF